MINKNLDIQMNIDFLCIELQLKIANIINDLNKTKYKAYSWELERISKVVYTIKTLNSSFENEEE